MDLAQVESGLVGCGIPADVVQEIIGTYVEAKRRYTLGDHRPQAVEGGRFTEAVFRALQAKVGQAPTPLGKSLPSVDKLLVQMENASGQSDSIRLHIPRTLRLLYDIRNKRDTAHLGDGIDPNLQDATLVIGNMDWVLAELVRICHPTVGPDKAQQIIDELVTKEVPAIEEIDGQPVILSDLKPRDQTLLMIYRAGTTGTSLDELAADLRVGRKDHLKTRVQKLDDERLVLIHPKTGRCSVTRLGIREVESRGLSQPA